MNNLAIRYVFDRKRQASDKKQGLLQIEVRVEKTSQKTFISTGIKVYKNQFSDLNGFTCKNHPNAQLITGKARRAFNKLEAFCLSEDCPNFESIKNWDREPDKTHSVVEFMKETLTRNDPSYAVVEYHRSLIRRIEEFGKLKTFADCTYENIVDFDAYLRKTIKSQPTLYKRHSTLHRYILDAINRGLCKFDPYRLFKLAKGKSKTPIFLDEKEMQNILDYSPTTERMKHVKDLFVFQMFTGLSYIDMSKFNKSYISKIDGMEIIRSNRSKTDESFVSLLLNEARTIIEKYNYELPVISNQKYNDYLKLLAAGAGVNKVLTSHTARHTYATYLLNKGVPIESVSRAMGHSNIKMTEHYAKMLGKKVVNDMAKLLNNSCYQE